jgi:phosphoserine phosphatase
MNADHAKFEAIIFDMDGTLTIEGSSWVFVHDHFGKGDAARKNLEGYLAQDISYREFMRLDISLWPPQLPISEIERILHAVRVSPGAQELIQFLSSRLKCLVLSAGIDLLAERVARELGITNCVANGLQVDGSRRLTGEGIERCALKGKVEAADSLLQRENVDWNQCVVVGDSKFDKDLLHFVGLKGGLSVSVGTDSKLRETAMLRVPDLATLLGVISKLQFDS